MSVAFRDARPVDAPILADLGRRTFIETFGHLYSREDLDTFLLNHAEERWRATLADPEIQVRLAEEGGAAAGYATLAPRALPVEPEGSALELRQLYILSPWHGRGIAPVLMDWILAQARARGAEELYLSVWTDNARAKSFYRRYGFTYVAPYAFMVGDQADEDEIWRLKLGEAE
jgi:ribosomal protein S18 acetylase RimI-like enzyme